MPKKNIINKLFAAGPLILLYYLSISEVDTNLETKIRGLFAAGECVGGANGANRLSGNAIPEAFVFGNIAGRNAAECPAKLGYLTATDAESLLHKSCSILEKNTDDRENKRLSIKATLKELKNVMWSNVGVLRTEEKLLSAMKTIKDIRENVFPHLRPEIGTVFNTSLMDWSDLRNSLICCEAICLAALGRRESRGAHQREDIPNTSEEFIKNQVIALNNNQLSVEWKNVKRKHFDLDRKRLANI